MGKYEIGEVIREARCRLGISQEELCYGICSPGNLSKIENGVRQPSVFTFRLLMERLGENVKAYPMYVSGQEMKRFRLKYEIEQDIYFDRYEEAEKKLLVFQEMLDQADIEGVQFVLMADSVCGRHSGRLSQEVALEKLEDGLHKTLPEFEARRTGKMFYTDVEMHLLINIASRYDDLGRSEEAIQLLQTLERQLHQVWKEKHQNVEHYPLVAFNLSNTLEDTGRYREAWQVAGEGARYCISEGVLYMFPYLLTNEGCNLVYDGQRKKGFERIR